MLYPLQWEIWKRVFVKKSFGVFDKNALGAVKYMCETKWNEIRLTSRFYHPEIFAYYKSELRTRWTGKQPTGLVTYLLIRSVNR